MNIKNIICGSGISIILALTIGFYIDIKRDIKAISIQEEKILERVFYDSFRTNNVPDKSIPPTDNLPKNQYKNNHNHPSIPIRPCENSQFAELSDYL